MNERTAASQGKQAAEPASQLRGISPRHSLVAENELNVRPFVIGNARLPSGPLPGPGTDPYTRTHLGHDSSRLQVHASAPSETYATEAFGPERCGCAGPAGEPRRGLDGTIRGG